MIRTFAFGVIALGGLNSILLGILAWRRIRVAGAARRRARLEERLRPVTLAFLDGDGELPPLTRREQEIVADALGEYARKLRGPARGRIVAYFESQGTVDRELAALATARPAWRRAAAAHRLGDIGSARVGDELVGALADDDRDVRTAAARSLGKLRHVGGVEPLLAAAAASAVPTAVASWATLQMGADARPALLRMLAADEPAERAGAISVLALVGDAADGRAVSAGLGDASASVRAAAAHALARLGAERDLEALLLALDDPSPDVRAAAATALGRLRDSRALVGLVAHAIEDAFDVAQAAARAAVALDAAACARIEATSDGPHLAEAVDLAQLA